MELKEKILSQIEREKDCGSRNIRIVIKPEILDKLKAENTDLITLDKEGVERFMGYPIDVYDRIRVDFYVTDTL